MYLGKINFFLEKSPEAPYCLAKEKNEVSFQKSIWQKECSTMSSISFVNAIVKSLILLCVAGSYCMAAGSLRPDGPREKRSFALPARLKYEHDNQNCAMRNIRFVNSDNGSQRGFRGSALPERIKYERANQARMMKGYSSRNGLSASTKNRGCSTVSKCCKKSGGSSGLSNHVESAHKKSGKQAKRSKAKQNSSKQDYIMSMGMPVLVP